MGLYDSVTFRCPDCGEKMEAQSKGGACDLETYPPAKVPFSVARDLHIFDRCKCGKAFDVVPVEESFVRVEIVEIEQSYSEYLIGKFRNET